MNIEDIALKIGTVLEREMRDHAPAQVVVTTLHVTFTLYSLSHELEERAFLLANSLSSQEQNDCGSLARMILISAADTLEFPEEVVRKAKIRKGELAFATEEISTIIDLLTLQKRAVIGLEAWKLSETSEIVEVINVNGFSELCKELQTTWDDYVTCCQTKALAFVQVESLFASPMYFNLLWIAITGDSWESLLHQ